MKKFVTVIMVAMLSMVLFATSAFAAGTKAYRENEPNNTQTQASSAYFQYPYFEDMRVFGSFNQSDTEDWYNVKLIDSTYSSMVTHTIFSGTPGCTYELNIFDSNMSPRGSVTSVSGSAVVITDILLRYNTPYYFQVKRISGDPAQPYDFQLRVDSAYKSLSDIKDKSLLEKFMKLEGSNDLIDPAGVTDENQAADEKDITSTNDEIKEN